MTRIEKNSKKNLHKLTFAGRGFARNVCALGILFVTSIGSIQAQTLNISGTVTNESGEPIVGASVVVKGTTIGAATGVNGDYNIAAPAEGVLVFSFLGMTTKEEPVDKRVRIDVKLSEDAHSIDEVVVVGYGQMKRSDLTGSVVSVSADAISKTISTSLDQALQGKAAGVQISQNSGIPGGSTSIRIRGINSLSASNEPIFVIDGVVIDGSTESSTSNALSSINPSDIVSIDVLKDASATAIYGSRGANGVILISTKRGQSGEAKVTYDGYVGLQTIPKRMEMLNLREFAEHRNENADLGIMQTSDEFVRPDLLGEGTDWQKEMFSAALMHNHNLSIAGGSDKNTYVLGGGYLNQEGIAIGSGFERLSLRGAFDSQVKKFLKAGANFNFSNSKQVITVSESSLIRTALRQAPNVAVRNADGTYGGSEEPENTQPNPVALALLNDNRNEIMDIRANTYLEATIIEGLTYKTELSFDYGVSNSYRFTPSYAFGVVVNETREGQQSKSYNRFYSWRNIVNYTKTLADVHSFNVMLGQEMQRSSWEYLYGYRSGYNSNNVTDLNAGDATTAKNDGQSGANALLSYFGRLFYSFDDRYLLTATLRRDGSSKYTKDNRWGWFPSAALAWKISSEDFFKNSDFLRSNVNAMKLRVGYGAVGNQNVPNNQTISTFATVPTNWGIGFLAANTANESLKWETTQSGNIGLDIGLLGNRVELIADVYYKQTDNLLLRVPLPAYAGMEIPMGDGLTQGGTEQPWANIGSLENKGFELTLNTVNIDKRNFQWRSSIVYSMNKNKVLAMDTETSIINKRLGDGSDVATVTRTAVGKPIGQFYGYNVIGRFEKGADFWYRDANGVIKQTAIPANMSISQGGVWIGDFIYEDVNRDGVINEEDCKYIGNPEPLFTFGFGNNFSYKGFDLSIYLTGSVGGDVVNYQRRWLENPNVSTSNIYRKALDYAHLSTTDANADYRQVSIVSGSPDMPRVVPRNTANSTSSQYNYWFSDRFVEDGSYLRLQNISLGYTLPQQWMQKAYIQNLRVYVNIQNLYTFTSYSGYDPEIGSLNQDALMTGIDNARYPAPKIYTVGLNLTF